MVIGKLGRQQCEYSENKKIREMSFHENQKLFYQTKRNNDSNMPEFKS